MSTIKDRRSKLMASKIPRRIIHAKGPAQLPKTRDEETVYEVVNFPDDDDTSSISSSNSASSRSKFGMTAKPRDIEYVRRQKVAEMEHELKTEEKAGFLASKEQIESLRNKVKDIQKLHTAGNLCEFYQLAEDIIRDSKQDDTHVDNVEVVSGEVEK